MTTIAEGSLTFSFPDSDLASKYDDWAFYRNQFQNVAGGSKAVDILFVTAHEAWLIEVKDYRLHPRTKTIDLAAEVAMKARDTLAGLAAASVNANDAQERKLAQRALSKRRWRVALHLEQPTHSSKLRPKPVDPTSVGDKLRRELRAIDAHPKTVDRSTSAGLVWGVATVPST